MPEDDQEPGRAVGAPKAQTPTTVPLSLNRTLDLSWLPEHERKALLTEYTKGLLDVDKKAYELEVDVVALKSTLHTLAEATDKMSESGHIISQDGSVVTESGKSVTATHTMDSSLGRTEIITGNTPEAHRGRLTSSQAGRRDMTPIYVIGGLIAAVLMAAIIFGE